MKTPPQYTKWLLECSRYRILLLKQRVKEAKKVKVSSRRIVEHVKSKVEKVSKSKKKTKENETPMMTTKMGIG